MNVTKGDTRSSETGGLLGKRSGGPKWALYDLIENRHKKEQCVFMNSIVSCVLMLLEGFCTDSELQNSTQVDFGKDRARLTRRDIGKREFASFVQVYKVLPPTPPTTQTSHPTLVGLIGILFPSVSVHQK